MAEAANRAALFDALSSVAKALGNGRRAQIIDVLTQGERSVEDVASDIGQSTANTSHHLRLLITAGILSRRRDGHHVYYRLKDDRVAQLWAAVRDVATEHVAAVRVLSQACPNDRSVVESFTDNCQPDSKTSH